MNILLKHHMKYTCAAYGIFKIVYNILLISY